MKEAYTMPSRGNILLKGLLSQEEINEYDILDEICNNMTDNNGVLVLHSVITFLHRKNELIRKANEVLKALNEQNLSEIG